MDLGNTVPVMFMDSTAAADDDFAGSCGGFGAPDHGYTWTAPADGTYTIDTNFSTLDTIIYVLDGNCAGAELVCDDDGIGPASIVVVDLVQDQQITIIVDGFSVFGGSFNLNIREGAFACPQGDLGNMVPAMISGDTSLYFDEFTSPICGGGGTSDAGYTFTAPMDGTYSFDTFGSSFETILSVRDGFCGGTEIVCGQEGILADLTAGQQVTVTVDSLFSTGTFDLRVGILGGICPNGDLGNSVPAVAMGDTAAGDNTNAGSCGGDFSPDDAYTFTAPGDGLYSFDTTGSAYDTVLHIRDGACDGPEIACNDDIGGGITQSLTTASLLDGQTVVVNVDGNGSGNYTLTVDQVTCPNADLGSTVPQTVFSTTLGEIDKLNPSCANPNAPDFAYNFTAPADGEYVFDTIGTGFNTVLYALDGADCVGTEIACNDNFMGNQSLISVMMTMGQQITVVVDGQFGAAGVFQLNVSALGGGLCPDSDLGSATPAMISGNTTGGDNTVAGTCGGFSQNDDTYTFMASQDGLYVFDTFGSALDTVLYLRDTDCGGSEIACNDDFGGNQSQITTNLVSGQEVLVAVDSNVGSGAYDLNIDFVPCPDIDIGNTVPDTFMGSTTGAVNKLSGTCALTQNSPDFAIQWTAPAADTYTFDTLGSNYDTALYILDGAGCGGPQLECDDDDAGMLLSFISEDLAADQTILIVVSGFNGDSGDFTLNIDNP